MKLLTLQYPAKCRDCGAALPAGSKAKYYGRGRVYGIGCHARPADRDQDVCEGDQVLTPRYAREHADSLPLGAVLSAHDKWGIYTLDGTKIGTSCGCIDYPCCGH